MRGWSGVGATWSGGSLPRRELGALALHPWPLLGTEQPPPPSQPFTRKEIIGFVIGSVSSALYLFSRLPQIRTNVSCGQGGRAVGRADGQLGPLGEGLAWGCGVFMEQVWSTLTVGLGN